MNVKHIPFALIYLRLVLGPVMIVLSYIHGKEYIIPIFIMLLVGLLSDIFDGIIARKLGVSSEKLRIADSKVDVVFWICTGISAYLLWPVTVQSKIVWVGLLFALEGICYGVSMLKFKRSACTHAYIAKLWGILLFLSLADLILFGQARLLFTLCVIVGIVADIENILITLTLKQWTHDIPSLYHAIKISKGQQIKRYKMFNG